MEATEELESFMKTGFKIVRRTKDSSSIKSLLKHFEDSIQELYGSGRRPTNAAKTLLVPAALLSKYLGGEVIDFDDASSSSSSSSSPIASASESIKEVGSSPPSTITLEQAKSDPVINIVSDSDSETEPYAACCCTCKESYVLMGNSLVECLGCQSMYHQNCHNPPIIDINLNDPRLAWYCIDCRQQDSQITDLRPLGKECNKSSSKNAFKAERFKFSSKSSQTKLCSGKARSSSANNSPKHYSSTSSTMMSFLDKRVKIMKKKAVKTSKTKN